jgi:Tfp pilus assembly protein FimT
MKNTRGFSLIELILFICIIAIIVFLALPFIPSLPVAQNSDSQAKDASSDVPISTEEPIDTNLSFPLPDLD